MGVISWMQSPPRLGRSRRKKTTTRGCGPGFLTWSLFNHVQTSKEHWAPEVRFAAHIKCSKRGSMVSHQGHPGINTRAGFQHTIANQTLKPHSTWIPSKMALSLNLITPLLENGLRSWEGNESLGGCTNSAAWVHTPEVQNCPFAEHVMCPISYCYPAIQQQIYL